MRRFSVMLGVSIALLLLSLTSCVTPPSFTGFNIADGTYVDPREDLTITWAVENPSNIPITFEVYLNGEKLAETEDNSYIISSGMLDWGEEYVFEVLGFDNNGNTVLDASVTFYTYAGELTVYAVDANSGPAVEGAKVFLNSEDTGKTTDSEGKVVLMIEKNPVDLLFKKEGYALSAVKNLEVVGEKIYKVLIRKAQLNPDPDTQILPEVNVEFYTDENKTTPADLENLTSNPYVVVNVDSENLVNIIYAAAGKIPGARFFGPRLYMSSTNTAEGYIDISGLEGETEIHVVVYDFNDNRVDLVFKANVIKSGSTEKEKYQVLRWSDFGGTNIDAYTRRREIEFYSLPGDIVKGFGKKFETLKELGMKPMAAPKDTNLWVDVWFIDYDVASYYGLIDPNSVEKPEAYRIYRSFDGVKWELAGVVSETDDFDVIFRDSDPRLSPGVKVYYKVSAYYPDGESTPVDLGYVVPLDTFNVQLKEPEDGAVNVSRDPTFVWQPTNDAFSVIPEDVTYNGTYTYTLWIYDLVQSENHLLPLDENYNQLFIESTDTREQSLKFSDYTWAVIAYDFGGSYIYPHSKLEPNKTYEWAVDLAYAYAEFKDESGRVVSSAYSIAIDEGYKVDYLGGVESDIFNTFTTGLE